MHLTKTTCPYAERRLARSRSTAAAVRSRRSTCKHNLWLRAWRLPGAIAVAGSKINEHHRDHRHRRWSPLSWRQNRNPGAGSLSFPPVCSGQSRKSLVLFTFMYALYDNPICRRQTVPQVHQAPDLVKPFLRTQIHAKSNTCTLGDASRVHHFLS